MLLCSMLVPARAAGPATLKLATWNLEWLLTPPTFNALKDHCTRSDQPHRFVQRSIPCDVAATLERSATDLAGMARYARQLDADVIALQETDGANAARQVFPHHGFCFTSGAAIQNTGFAIRRGIPYRCGADVTALSLGESVRRGATVLLYPGSRHELTLLAVHLKSGCARQDLAASVHACSRLARQAPALRDWLLAQRNAGHAYAVLGDFNRDLLAEAQAPGLWSQLNAGSEGPLLYNTAQGQVFRNCHAGQPHTGYIDYILLGDALHRRMIAGSFERLSYSATDAWRLKLSDHCPVAIKLRLD